MGIDLLNLNTPHNIIPIHTNKKERIMKSLNKTYSIWGKNINNHTINQKSKLCKTHHIIHKNKENHK